MAADAKYDAIARVLDTYADGRYDDAVSQLRAVRGFSALSKDFRSQAPKWIAIASPEVRERRRRVVATVALETALLGFSDPRLTQFQRMDALNVVEFGCDLLRHGEPTDFEHAWMLASVALIQGAKNFGPDQAGPLIGDARAQVLNPPFHLHAAEHHKHASARFPDDGRFALGRIVTRAEARRMPNRPGFSATGMVTGYESVSPLEPITEEQARGFIKATIHDLTSLLALQPARAVAAEAQLRRGILLFHRNELAASLVDTGAAAATASPDDPYVPFVANMYVGLSLDSLSRRTEAMDAYATALHLVPNARSAAEALAADLFLAGQHEQAAALLQAAFHEPAPPDPWRLFSAGDYRFWPKDLARLRAALHP